MRIAEKYCISGNFQGIDLYFKNFTGKSSIPEI